MTGSRLGSLAKSREFQDVNHRNGIWDGQVVSLDDPNKIGRVKVRIFMIHGEEDETPDAALPWAEVSYIGGAYDSGSFDPPPEGAKVYVMFKYAKERLPIVIGSARGKPKKSQKLRAMRSGEEEPTWDTPADELETPKEVFHKKEDNDLHPTVRVWHKSVKGHTVMIEEKDGEEYLKIIDRGGQVIELNCPLSDTSNQALSGQRGLDDASKDTQKEQDESPNYRGFIRIVDVAGQEILLDGRAGNEQIIIRNQNRSSSRPQSLTLSNTKGKEFVELVDQQGNKIRLASNEDDRIVIEDTNGSQVSFTQEGHLELKSKKNLVLSPNVDVTSIIGGDLNQTVKGSKDVGVLGNLGVNVANETNVGLMSSAKVNVGGNVSLLLGNAPVGGVTPNIPANAVLEMFAPTGGLKFNTLSGGIRLINGLDTAPLAGLEINEAGTEVKLYGLTEQAYVKTAWDTVRVGGRRVMLGTDVPLQYALKGFTVIGAMETFLNTLITGINPGSTAQNAGALTLLKSAAATLQATLENWGSDVVYFG